MSNQNINGYEIERFSIGDDDYFDIDWLDGAVYKTAKVKGSIIKAIASGVNIYNSDGVLLSNRTITGNAFKMLFTFLQQFRVEVVGDPTLNEAPIKFQIQNLYGDDQFEIYEITTNRSRFKILNDGRVELNQEFAFPLLDGNAGDVLQTDGSGNVTFQPVVASNIYNSNGALTGNRIVSGSFFDLFFLDHNSFIFQTSNNGTDTQNGVWFDIEETNVLNGGNLFRIRKKGGVGVGVDRFRVLKNGQIEFNEEYKFPLLDGTAGSILQTDGSGNLSFGNLDQYVNFSSTQWSKSIPSTILATGQTANGFSFFTDSDLLVNGSTAYDQYSISFGRLLTLTGTNGTANININGINYLATFNTTLTQTAIDFVTLHQSTLLALGVQVFANAGILRFGGTNTILNTITITTITGNLNGTLNTAISDHVVIPYLNRPYFGQRLQHELRVNFNIAVGSNNFYQLSLRRWADDSIIGSPITIERNPDYTGQQHVFISYTAGANDPFVTGGFYFAFFNNSGQNVTFIDGAGIYIQTKFQKPTKF